MQHLVADRILDLAVQRVKRNCRIAAQTRGSFTVQHAMRLIHPQNQQLIESAISSAQLVLSAEPSASVA